MEKMDGKSDAAWSEGRSFGNKVKINTNKPCTIFFACIVGDLPKSW